MDDSTEGVTLNAGFVFDLLEAFEPNRETYAAPLFAMAEGLDPDAPDEPAPMQLYNEMCAWIENQLGEASLRRAGIAIGNRAFDFLASSGELPPNPGPLEILEGLLQAADTMIQDPKNRGWEIRENTPGKIVMRRTQTFNCVLQEGLLKSLVARTGVRLPGAEHISCTRKGAEFCEYAVTWLD